MNKDQSDLDDFWKSLPKDERQNLEDAVLKSLQQRKELKPGEEDKDAGGKKDPVAPARNPPP